MNCSTVSGHHPCSSFAYVVAYVDDKRPMQYSILWARSNVCLLQKTCTYMTSISDYLEDQGNSGRPRQCQFTYSLCMEFFPSRYSSHSPTLFHSHAPRPFTRITFNLPRIKIVASSCASSYVSMLPSGQYIM